MNPSKNKPSHLRALLRKNWILWQRSWCVSCLEIIVPLLFAAIMLAFRKVAPVTAMPEESYYQNPDWLFNFDGALTSADKSFFKDCNDNVGGGAVGLVSTEGATIMTKLKGYLGNETFYFKLKCY